MSIIDVLFPLPPLAVLVVLKEEPWVGGAPSTRTWTYYSDIPGGWLRFASTWMRRGYVQVRVEDCPERILSLESFDVICERYIVVDWDWPTLDGRPLGHWEKI